MHSESTAQRPSALKVLAISYWYPPSTEPRAVQVSRLLRYLDVSLVLACARSGDFSKTNAGAGAPSFPQTTIKVPSTRAAWRRVIDRFSAHVYIPIWARTPDPLVTWKRAALNLIERFIANSEYQPDVMVTFAFPLTDHLIGLRLKQKYKFPWLAHFSDPWTDNPFKNEDRLTRALNAALERRVIENADRIVFTSDETVDLVMQKYDCSLRSKVRVIPHCYEPELFAKASRAERPQSIVRYLGELYLNRTPQPLFEALKRLSSSDPQLLRDVSFEIVGSTHDLDLKEMGLRDLPAGLVSIRPRVGYLESLFLMSDSDGLVVIDAPASTSVFLPSKLIEYVGAGRPIIGLTPPGAAASLISRLGGWVANPNNDGEMAQAIKHFLSYLADHRADVSATWGLAEVRKQYEAKEVARKFDNVIADLVT
jgi:glycosyltransferase involved in cell wall biosynthesis